MKKAREYEDKLLKYKIRQEKTEGGERQERTEGGERQERTEGGGERQ